MEGEKNFGAGLSARTQSPPAGTSAGEEGSAGGDPTSPQPDTGPGPDCLPALAPTPAPHRLGCLERGAGAGPASAVLLGWRGQDPRDPCACSARHFPARAGYRVELQLVRGVWGGNGGSHRCTSPRRHRGCIPLICRMAFHKNKYSVTYY